MGIAAFLISSKYEEIYPPECKDFIKISGEELIKKDDILKIEFDILSALDFNISIHSAYRFMERLVKLINADEIIFKYAMYIVELSMFYTEFSST